MRTLMIIVAALTIFNTCLLVVGGALGLVRPEIRIRFLWGEPQAVAPAQPEPKCQPAYPYYHPQWDVD